MRNLRSLAVMASVSGLLSGAGCAKKVENVRDTVTQPTHTASQAGHPTELFLESAFRNDLHIQNLGQFERFDSAILVNTTTRLVRTTNNRGIDPLLAERWDIDPTGRVITFHLRKDARFSDGTPITATDVIWSVQRMFVNKGQYTDLFLHKLEGWEGLKNCDSSISGLSSPDPNTVVVRLTEPTEHVIDVLFATLPTSVFEKGDVPELQDRITGSFKASGPYVLESITPEEVILRRNPYHWSMGRPNVAETIRLRRQKDGRLVDRLLNGTLDFAKYVPESTFDVATARSKGLQIVDRNPTHFYMAADYSGPGTVVCPKLGSFLTRMIDRDALVENLGAPYVSKPTPAIGYFAGIGILQQELAKGPSPEARRTAAAELQAACPKLFDGNQFINVGVSENAPEDAEMVRGVAVQLKAFGLNARLVPVPFFELISTTHPGRFDYILLRYIATPSSPARSLPYLIGLDPRRSNLPPTHPVFGIHERLSHPHTEADEIQIVREFNAWAQHDGFMISLAEDEFATMFSARIDISNLPAAQLYFDGTDMPFKSG